jgi:Glycosyltransferase family 28 C-terminal domain
MWQKGVGARALRYRKLFAAVLEPGDLASAGDVGRTTELTDARRLGPVTLVGHIPAISREQARTELGLDQDRPTLLLTLGSNRRTDMYAAYQRTVEKFSAAGWQVAVTSSPVRTQGSLAGGPRKISVFPLVRYLRAFDAAVSASGYNAVHELLYSSVPTLLVPNTEAVTDDQRTRARVVAGTGLALSADPERPREFDAALDRLLDERVRERLIAGCLELPDTMGATEAARAVIGFAAAGKPATSERMDAAALHAQRFARRQVGRVLPPAVAGLIGRPPRLSDLRGPLTAALRLSPAADGSLSPVPPPDEGELLVTDRLENGLFEGRWVEHLISGASDDYLRNRAAIAERYYRVAGRQGDGPTAERWAGLGWSG